MIPNTIDSNKTFTNNANRVNEDGTIHDNGDILNNIVSTTNNNTIDTIDNNEDSTVDNNDIVFDDDVRKSHWYW